MTPLMITVIAIFVVTYILMFTLQKYRPFIAGGAAVIFVILGSTGVFPEFRYTVSDAIQKIDFNVLLMITGTMGTVFLFIRSTMPHLLADTIVTKTGTVRVMVIALCAFAGIVSAFVDNVATVLMVAPVAIAICRQQKISPVPVVICISISSNLQGAATLVGDTTSILLAKQAGLDFSDFFVCQGKPGMFFVTELGALVSLVIIAVMFRNMDQKITPGKSTPVQDKVPSLLLVLTIASLIVTSFIPYQDQAASGEFYKPDISNGIICMTFYLIGILRQTILDKNTKVAAESVKEIDFYTLGLLAGLFVVIGAVEKAGLIELIGMKLALLGNGGTKGSIFLVYSVIVWASVLLSAFIDNIPYTATMLPVVAVLAANLTKNTGIAVNPNLLYFGLLAGATLGGNLTPVGASANITSLGILRKEGHEVSTGNFMKYSVPFTLAAVITGYLLIWLIWS